jgi:hypothetical protein
MGKKSVQTQEQLDQEIVDFKKELSLDSVISGIEQKTIRYEVGKEGMTDATRLERLKQIRAQLGKRYKAVVDFTEHGFSSGAHLVKFVVQG